ncbi:TetR/AcrR family transcriptional regulator [Aeromicrobium sp. CF4.19]|uniref:TetR/AcrR family transcriptional regulator n=1 Tax=Aeromicrobium sp. CF4.19 TaxID=3373082 RepID=UPI003EE58D62
MSRLTAARRAELHRGALALVAELGYDRVTMDQIAERTHSSKATLYRQWGSKASLVVEAIAAMAGKDDELPDTGTLPGDLHEMIRRRPRPDETGIAADLIASLLQAVKTDPDLADAVRSDITGGVLRDLALVVGRAVDRGEIPQPAASIEQIGTALMAPFVLHHTLCGAEPEDAELIAYLDAVVLPALGIS